MSVCLRPARRLFHSLGPAAKKKVRLTTQVLEPAERICDSTVLDVFPDIVVLGDAQSTNLA